MRASSLRSLRGLGAAVAVLGLCGLGACDKSDPTPQKVERLSPFERGEAKRPAGDPDSPLRNPGREAPSGREGAQLPAAEIEAALAEAAKQGEIGNTVAQRNALRACANKTPASARCDGEMGLAQIGSRNRRATALYYLVEASKVDEPEADADLYRRVGQALRDHGKSDAAVAALRLAVARDDSAANLFLLGQTLSLQPEHLPEAIDTIAAARAKDDQLQWLYEQAVLSGQLPIRERAEAAVELFGAYVERAKAVEAGTKLPSPIATVEIRMKELEQLAKQLPTQAEAEAGAGGGAGAGQAAGTEPAGDAKPAGDTEPEPPAAPQ